MTVSQIESNNPGAYHKFMKVLTEQGKWCELLVKKLSSCYEAQTATPESSTVSLTLSNIKSQRKLRLEFIVPQDVNLKVFKTLEAVQVSVLCEDQVNTIIFENNNFLLIIDSRISPAELPLSHHSDKVRGQPCWHYVLLADEEDTVANFHNENKTRSINVADYDQILKSGWGEEPSDEVREWIDKQYLMNYNYKPPANDMST